MVHRHGQHCLLSAKVLLVGMVLMVLQVQMVSMVRMVPQVVMVSMAMMVPTVLTVSMATMVPRLPLFHLMEVHRLFRHMHSDQFLIADRLHKNLFISIINAVYTIPT
jgi:hypothetical protein